MNRSLIYLLALFVLAGTASALGVTDTLLEGETGVYTIDSGDFVVTNLVSTADRTKFLINGVVTEALDIGESTSGDDWQLTLRELTQTTQSGEPGIVQFCLNKNGDCLIEDTLQEGQTKRYGIQGVEYEVSALNLGVAYAKFLINGTVTDSIPTGDTESVLDIEIEVLEVFDTTAYAYDAEFQLNTPNQAVDPIVEITDPDTNDEVGTQVTVRWDAPEGAGNIEITAYINPLGNKVKASSSAGSVLLDLTEIYPEQNERITISAKAENQRGYNAINAEAVYVYYAGDDVPAPDGCEGIDSQSACLDDSACYWDQETDRCYAFTDFDDVECTDPDGGKDLYERGHTYGFRTYCSSERDCRIRTGGRDACLPDDTLNEHYCDGSYIESYTTECEFGCINGACLPAPSTDPLDITISAQALEGSTDVRPISFTDRESLDEVMSILEQSRWPAPTFTLYEDIDFSQYDDKIVIVAYQGELKAVVGDDADSKYVLVAIDVLADFYDLGSPDGQVTPLPPGYTMLTSEAQGKEIWELFGEEPVDDTLVEYTLRNCATEDEQCESVTSTLSIGSSETLELRGMDFEVKLTDVSEDGARFLVDRVASTPYIAEGREYWFSAYSFTYIRVDAITGSAVYRPPSCSETDGGRDYDMYSRTADREGSQPDSCDGDVLTEWYCAGDAKQSVRYTCPHGCREGACLSDSGEFEDDDGEYSRFYIRNDETGECKLIAGDIVPTGWTRVESCEDDDGHLNGPISIGQSFDLSGATYTYIAIDRDDLILSFETGRSVYEASYFTRSDSTSSFAIVRNGVQYDGVLRGDHAIYVENAQNIQRSGAPGGQTCEGCQTQDLCYQIGTRVKQDAASMYCDLDGTLKEQKADGVTCENNFECATNQCSSGSCIDLAAELAENRSLLERILSWIDRLFN